MKLDRTIAPQGKALQIRSLPDFETHHLDNGIKVYALPFGKVEAVNISANFTGGIGFQQGPGIASYMGSIMNEGTKSYTGIQLAHKLDEYGAWLSHQVGEASISFELATLSHHLAPTLPLLYEVLYEPLFDQEEFSKMKARNLQKKEIASQKTTYHAQRLFGHLLYGAQHPYGMHLGKEELQKIELGQLQAYHQQFIHPSNCFFTVIGNFDRAEVIALLNQHFGQGKLGKIEIPTPSTADIPPLNEKGYHHHHLDKMQSTIKLGHPGFERKHPDYYGMRVVNTILGGYFGSRLTKNIREDKGYTYGISSGWASYQHTGHFTIQSDVGNEYVKPALQEIDKELKRMIDEIVPEDELQLVKNYLIGQSVNQRETLFQMSDLLRYAIVFDIPFKEMDRRFEVIQQITAVEIQELAEKYFQPAQLLTVVCGGDS